MNITPVIPDGYNGQVKRLTCRICKHLFYLAIADYERLREVSYCHECSLILLEELQRNHEGQSSTVPGQTARPASLPLKQASARVLRPPEPELVSPRPTLHVPQPRSIDRDKMTVAQLIEEAKMLAKTWRYKEALFSYEQALRRDPGCLEALCGKGAMLSQLGRSREALAAYDDILQLDPTSAKASGEKGYAEAVKAYDHVIRLRPDFVGAYRSKVRALEKLKHYGQALATCNKGLQLSPENLSLLCARAGVLKKFLRYEEANAEYDRVERIDPHSLYVISSIIGKVDLKE